MLQRFDHAWASLQQRHRLLLPWHESRQGERAPGRGPLAPRRDPPPWLKSVAGASPPAQLVGDDQPWVHNGDLG